MTDPFRARNYMIDLGGLTDRFVKNHLDLNDSEIASDEEEARVVATVSMDQERRMFVDHRFAIYELVEPVPRL